MNFSENSRIWIYQSNRELTPAELSQANQILTAFTADWTAHNHALKARGEVRHNRFIILTVDESQAGATGCSIDKSVNLIKALEKEFNINLFDRFNTAYRQPDSTIATANRTEFETLIKQGEITADTIVFNNLVNTLGDMPAKWEVAYKNSWHKQVFGDLVTV